MEGAAMNWEGYEVDGQMDISEFLDKGESMAEKETIKRLEVLERAYRIAKNDTALKEVLMAFVTLEDLCMAINALEEIQKYRAIGTVEDIQKILSFLGDENKRSIIDDLKLLNEYKDGEEQGLLHKAPLKNGTPIWYLLEGFDEGAYLTQSTYLYNVTEYEIGELGKKFWLSEKEAEQALAKMKAGGIDD